MLRRRTDAPRPFHRNAHNGSHYMSMQRRPPPVATATFRRTASVIGTTPRRYDRSIFVAARVAGLSVADAARHAFIGTTKPGGTNNEKPSLRNVDNEVKDKLQEVQLLILDTLMNGDKLAEAKVSELGTVLGVVTDRLRLYQNKSTSNVAHQNGPDPRADRIRAILAGTVRPPVGSGPVAGGDDGDMGGDAGPSYPSEPLS